MRRLTTVVLAGIMLTAGLAYAGGDLIVDGNVGIGTSTPNAKLQLYPTVDGGINLKLFEFAAVGTTNSSWSTVIGNNVKASESNADQMEAAATHPTYAGAAIYLNGADGIVFHTKSGPATKGEVYSSPRMAITPSGNVGIGTTNPGAILEIFTPAGYYDKPYLVQKYNYAGYDVFHTYMDGYYSTVLETNGPAGQNRHLILNPVGNVGINTLNPTCTLDVNGTIKGTSISPSDAKFKKNLLPITTPLDKVLSLDGHSYEWKTGEYKEKNFPAGRHYGVIAQEIEKVLPEVVNTDPKGEKSVAYTEIIPVLIEAIKEQQKIIEAQQKEIHEIKSLISK